MFHQLGGWWFDLKNVGFRCHFRSLRTLVRLLFLFHRLTHFFLGILTKQPGRKCLGVETKGDHLKGLRNSHWSRLHSLLDCLVSGCCNQCQADLVLHYTVYSRGVDIFLVAVNESQHGDSFIAGETTFCALEWGKEFIPHSSWKESCYELVSILYDTGFLCPEGFCHLFCFPFYKGVDSFSWRRKEKK